MGRNSRKGAIHKVTEFEMFSDVIEVNSLTAKLMFKYIEYLNYQAYRRLLPQIELKIIDERIKPHTLWDKIYRKDYTLTIFSPEINIGDYRPLKLIQMIKEYQLLDNFNFFETTQPVDKNGKVIKEIFPYLLTNSNKRIKKIAIKDLLKISKLIIDTYSYCRKKDIVIESFNWIRTTGEKAFDILNTEPSTQFNDKCMEKLHEEDEEINLMLSWSRICSLKEYKFKEFTKQDYCSFADINKVVALIPIYRLLNGNKRIKYFVHQE